MFFPNKIWIGYEQSFNANADWKEFVCQSGEWYVETEKVDGRLETILSSKFLMDVMSDTITKSCRLNTNSIVITSDVSIETETNVCIRGCLYQCAVGKWDCFDSGGLRRIRLVFQNKPKSPDRLKTVKSPDGIKSPDELNTQESQKLVRIVIESSPS